jgi:hypothetical protein
VCCWSVGLVQCEIEAAGFSTISLSMMPELTASAGSPRIAAVEHPFGLTMGLPGDIDGQLATLRATLRALAAISEPGGVVDLPFEWDQGARLNTFPPQLPPIASYLRRHPWAFPQFFNRTPPERTAPRRSP